MHTRTFSWKTLATGFYLFIAILSPGVLSGCAAGRVEQASATNTPPSTQPDSRAVAPPSAPTSTPAAANVAAVANASPPPPPQPSEVESALARVYQTAVVVADAPGRASALAGDFNGDGSQDIAVVVKPNKAQLSEINSEFAAWIVEDPRRVFLPLLPTRTNQAPPAHQPSQVEAGETLLAIIHGYKSEGWRNPDAKQTYLLKNANGTQMRTQTRTEAREMVKAEAANSAAPHRLPYMHGDLIWQVLDGKAGWLYWTGAKYGWYDQTQDRQVAKAKGKDASHGQ